MANSWWAKLGLFRPRKSRRATAARATRRLRLEALEDRTLPAPLAPTGLVATGVSSSAISLTWDASTDPTVTGYDVYEKVWVRTSGGKGGSSGHYVYNLIDSNLPTNSDTITGLAAGSSHTYLVTDLNSTGQSLYSYAAAAETWIAPKGSDYVRLSSGAQWYIPSGAINATAGLTTQVTPYVSGNPLTFSITSGPSTASIDPNTGVLTYTPDPSEVGPVSITIDASNALGDVTQTIPFNVVAADPTLATPTLTVNGTTATYTGKNQQVTATAYGADGVTPVSGTYQIAYNASAGNSPYLAGTYQVLVTFTSSDPNYGNATVLTTLTINQASPTFSNLSSPTIAQGDATTTVSGNIADGTVYPVGDYVIVTLNGVSQDATVGANGNFSATFATSALPVGGYTITYSYAGDSNFNAASDGSGTLTVVPTAPPQVTQNPSNRTTSAGDYVSFTAAATGSPTPTVQWQVSTDGGTTWTNITGNASATTTTLTFLASTTQNGYHYRAVFTNRVGVATTTDAVLKVESD
jgi:Immunoglobulin I-set domain